MTSQTVQDWSYKHFKYKQIDVANKYAIIKYISECIFFLEISMTQAIATAGEETSKPVPAIKNKSREISIRQKPRCEMKEK